MNTPEKKKIALFCRMLQFAFPHSSQFLTAICIMFFRVSIFFPPGELILYFLALHPELASKIFFNADLTFSNTITLVVRLTITVFHLFLSCYF